MPLFKIVLLDIQSVLEHWPVDSSFICVISVSGTEEQSIMLDKPHFMTALQDFVH